MVATRNELICTVDPRGRMIEGVCFGTPKPGTMMQIKPGVEPDGTGRLTYRVFDGAADGERDEVLILLPNTLLGKTEDTAYASGDRCFMYMPCVGEEIRVRCANLTGTGSGTDDAFAIGDKLMPDDGTGKFVKTTGSPEMEPFKVLETIAAIQTDTLVLCRYTNY